MPDTGAPWNIPYVDPTDLVRDYPDASEDLADAIADGLSAAGGLVASKFVIKTDTQVSSLTTGNSAAVSGLTIDHSVADAANHVILIAQMSGDQQTGQRPAFSLTAGGTAIAIGDADGVRVRVGASSSSFSSGGDVMGSMTLVARHTPGVTTSVTYGVNIVNVRTGTVNNFVNRDGVDSNAADSARSASTLLLLEVKV